MQLLNIIQILFKLLKNTEFQKFGMEMLNQNLENLLINL